MCGLRSIDDWNCVHVHMFWYTVPCPLKHDVVSWENGLQSLTKIWRVHTAALADTRLDGRRIGVFDSRPQ